MRETPAGLLVADVQEEKCDHCGVCRLVCPGAELELGGLEGVDPFKGRVVKAYSGHACEDGIRASGQSGGVVSALLLFLLESGKIDRALTTAMPMDGSLRPRPLLVRTRGEVLAAQGSKYCPAAPCALLGDIKDDDRVAVVGIPCQMHGMQRALRQGSSLVSGIIYKIGLFCDRTLLNSCIDHMARQTRLEMGQLAGLEFRSKKRNGWPGEVCFHLVSGEKRFFPPALRTGLKDFYTPPRCRLCFDKLNVFADVAVGDAWGVEPTAAGDSVLLARNERGDGLIREAMASGYMQAREIDAELVFRGQGSERRRLDFSSFMRLSGQAGRPFPKYEGLAPGFLKAGDPSLDARNRRRLFYSLRIASSVGREKALAQARTWQRRQTRIDLFGALREKLRGLLRLLRAGRRS
jgi:coenzyme F420 hydrogenase subunit beta